MAERRNYDRVDRVSQQILQILSGLLLHDVRDPNLQQIQLTAVDVSRDLQVATVYYVMMTESPNPSKAVLRGLDRANGFLRRKLGEELTLRHTPELRFKFDKSILQGRRIESILSELEIPPPDPEELEDPKDPNSDWDHDDPDLE